MPTVNGPESPQRTRERPYHVPPPALIDFVLGRAALIRAHLAELPPVEHLTAGAQACVMVMRGYSCPEDSRSITRSDHKCLAPLSAGNLLPATATSVSFASDLAKHPQVRRSRQILTWFCIKSSPSSSEGWSASISRGSSSSSDDSYTVRLRFGGLGCTSSPSPWCASSADIWSTFCFPTSGARTREGRWSGVFLRTSGGQAGSKRPYLKGSVVPAP